MFVKVKGALVELLHEEPKTGDHGLMIVFGILMFTFGIAAAILLTM